MIVIKTRELDNYVYWAESGGWTDWLYQAQFFGSEEAAWELAGRLGLRDAIVAPAVLELRWSGLRDVVC